MTFKRRDADVFWTVPAGTDTQNTMIGHNPILIPLDDAGYFGAGNSINWESDWGFRAVGDRFAPAAFNVAGVQSQGGSCVLELATAANAVEDWGYWTSVRLCSQKFTETLDDFTRGGLPNALIDLTGNLASPQRRWYPMQDFVAAYNAKVQGLPARDGLEKTRFEMKVSASITALAGGTYNDPDYGDQTGVHWDAYITTWTDPNNTSNKWCDVQVNYQMDLKNLFDNTDLWINSWASSWAYKLNVGGNVLDPDIGNTRVTADIEVYKTQTYAALWRAARVQVLGTWNVPDVAAQAKSMIQALVMYVLAVGAITSVAAGSTNKNSYPQLPKTSPASIASQIAALVPAAAPYLNNQAAALQTARYAMTILRDPNTLLKTGGLPAGSPMKTMPLYSNESGRMVANIPTGSIGNSKHVPPPPANFDNMWTATFTPPVPPNALAAYARGPPPTGNNFGFTTQNPFFVDWADGVNTSLQATLYGPAHDKIKMLFESRYGTDVLNLGFNPYIQDFMFNRSYVSLVKLMAGDAAATSAKASIQRYYPDNPAIKQNFKDGPH